MAPAGFGTNSPQFGFLRAPRDHKRRALQLFRGCARSALRNTGHNRERGIVRQLVTDRDRSVDWRSSCRPHHATWRGRYHWPRRDGAFYLADCAGRSRNARFGHGDVADRPLLGAHHAVARHDRARNHAVRFLRQGLRLCHDRLQYRWYSFPADFRGNHGSRKPAAGFHCSSGLLPDCRSDCSDAAPSPVLICGARRSGDLKSAELPHVLAAARSGSSISFRCPQFLTHCRVPYVTTESHFVPAAWLPFVPNWVPVAFAACPLPNVSILIAYLISG